jgi:N-acetylglucosamine-6-phosphate deacetylase
MRLVEDAVVVIAGDNIVGAGDYWSWMEIESAILEFGSGRADVDRRTALAVRAAEQARRWDGLILPGLVDVHCHGGGGQSFPDARTRAEALVAAREHLRFGTTSLIASLVTDEPEVLVRQAALLAELCESGDLAGIHLEGPFLSARRAGAQDPAKMQVPNPELVWKVAHAAKGRLAVMTVAPELPGVAPGGGAGGAGSAGAASGTGAGAGAGRRGGGAGGRGAASGTCVIDALAGVGAVPSFGHTDCSAAQMGAAVAAADTALADYAARARERGSKAAGLGLPRVATATHLFNGMRPIHHRDPGPAMEALAQAAAGAMVVELIADGVHLDPRLVGEVFGLVGWRNVTLVTDAMAAAGMPDGEYQLGPASVTVAGGVARLTGGESIAGGTAHLIDVVRSAWRDSGVDLASAVGAASLVPARVLGRAHRIGSLAPGRAADLVLADEDLRAVEVWRRGAQV